jgi:hypothetical protein
MAKVIKMTPELQKKSEGFDKADEHFKKIYTKNGINKLELINFIEDTIQLMPQEGKSDFAQHIIFHILLWSSYNLYEALGILECAKVDYYESWINMNEDDED